MWIQAGMYCTVPTVREEVFLLTCTQTITGGNHARVCLSLSHSHLVRLSVSHSHYSRSHYALLYVICYFMRQTCMTLSVGFC